MKLVGVSPAHANSWLGSGVCMKAADGLVIVWSIIVYVHGKSQTWSIQFGETVHSWTYEKVCEAKSLFMKTQNHNYY
jgi:ribosomal protein L35AE/L33A